MTTNIPSLLRRLLRQVNSHMKSAHRRQKTSLAARLEAVKPSVDSSPLTQQPSLTTSRKPKRYDELPTPRRYPLLGTLPDFLRAGGVQQWHKYASKLHQELGGVFREPVAGTELVFVADPAEVRKVFASEGQHPRHILPEAWLLYNKDRQVTRGLLFMDGEEWKENRSVMNRCMLRPSSVVRHLGAFNRVADAVISRWITQFAGQAVPDLERELYRWAIESLGVMVFGSRLGFVSHDLEGPRRAEDTARQVEMEKFTDAIHGIFKETSAMGTIPPALAKALRLPVWTRLADAMDRALAAGKLLVAEGLRASQEEGNRAPLTMLDELLHHERLDQDRIITLLTDLFIGAADTTSHTAIWSLYLLGSHPEKAQRARQEVLDATGGSEDIQSEHLASLPYLKGVVKETLRLYPVTPFQSRALDCDTELAGHLVPAGTMIILSVYTTGRDPAHFTRPDDFCPERWLRDTSDAPCPASPNRLHSHAFIPFGVGVRSCIGRRVAEIELYLLLAKLLTRCDLQALNRVDIILRMVGVTSEPLQLRLNPLTCKQTK